MIGILILLSLAIAQREAVAVTREFHWICDNAFVLDGAARARCNADPPNCFGALAPPRPYIWYVAGLPGAPRWVCTWDHEPEFMRPQ